MHKLSTKNNTVLVQLVYANIEKYEPNRCFMNGDKYGRYYFKGQNKH
jgi:hypothetical protein